MHYPSLSLIVFMPSPAADLFAPDTPVAPIAPVAPAVADHAAHASGYTSATGPTGDAAQTADVDLVFAAAPAPAPRVRPLSGQVIITRQVHFNAAHRLHNPTQSAAWNEKTYGLCNNLRGHGHNYVLEVSLIGAPDPVTGYLMELGALQNLLQTAILQKCDHRHLNEEVDFLRDVIPSTENLVIAFWQELAPRITHGRLYCVKLYETPRNFAEFYGPDAFPSPRP